MGVRRRDVISRLFFVEGPTDRKVIKNIFDRVNCRIFNPWELDFRKIEAVITAETNIFLVLDMDNITLGKTSHFEKITSCKQQLIKNLKKMAKLSNIKNIFICPQYFELEDEIVSASNLRNKKNLYRHFGAAGERECKDKIIECTNLNDKFTEILFNKDNLWANSHGNDLEFFHACKNVHAKIYVSGIDVGVPYQFL